jgi:hypothetical protein
VAYPPEAVNERSRFDRIWPSLVALVGTVAVVLALLWAFGGDLDPESGEEDLAAEEADASDPESEPDADSDDGTVDGDEEAGSEEPPGEPVEAPPELRQNVGILNATAVQGLASRAQERFQSGGWTVPAIGSYSQPVDTSTIYYPPDMEESAEALRAQFPEITRSEPTIPGLARDRLVVILAQDYADAVGDTG